MEEVYEKEKRTDQRLTALFLTPGFAGTLGCSDYLRERYPTIKACAGEARQCPTLLFTGYGGHRIEGTAGKHVHWIFNVKNIDVVVDINDEYCMRLMSFLMKPVAENI